MNIWLSESASESNDIQEKLFIVEYINKDDRSASDRVYAKNEKDARKKIKSRAYKILKVYESND